MLRVFLPLFVVLWKSQGYCCWKYFRGSHLNVATVDCPSMCWSMWIAVEWDAGAVSTRDLRGHGPREQIWVKADLDQIIISAQKCHPLWPLHEIQYVREVEGEKNITQRNPGDWRFVNAKLWLWCMVRMVLVEWWWECSPKEILRLFGDQLLCQKGRDHNNSSSVTQDLGTSNVKYHFTKQTNKSQRELGWHRLSQVWLWHCCETQSFSTATLQSPMHTHIFLH